MENKTIEKGTMKIGCYTLLKEMGSGSFGSVYYCQHTETHREYAGKLFNMSFIKEKEGWSMIEREARILRLLTHYRTIKYEDIVYSPYGILLIMELVHGRTLIELFPEDGGFVESLARSIFKQLLEALHFLHHNGIVHRDVKLENVMIERQGNVKLIDYGLAEYFPKCKGRNEKLLVDGLSGSPHYYAPEIIRAGSDDKFRGDKTDIWAAGIFLYILVSGFRPFNGEDDYAIYEDICSSEVCFKDAGFSAELEDLLGKILEKDPERRASIPDIMVHPWMKARRLKAGLTTFYGKGGRVKIDIYHRLPKGSGSCNVSFPKAARKNGFFDTRLSRSCEGRFVHEYMGKVPQLKAPLLKKHASDATESVGSVCEIQPNECEETSQNTREEKGNRLMKIKKLFSPKAKKSERVLGDSEKEDMANFARREAERDLGVSKRVKETADVFTHPVQERKMKRHCFVALLMWLCPKCGNGGSRNSSQE